MIQIIGFLICACLAVKLLEMGANPAFKGENGERVPGINAALLFGWCAFPLFVFWLLAQGEAFPDIDAAQPANEAPLTQEQIDCIEKNTGDMNAVLACAP